MLKNFRYNRVRRKVIVWKYFNREKRLKMSENKMLMKIKIITERWLGYCKKKWHGILKRKSNSNSIRSGFYNISLLDLQKYTAVHCWYALSSVLDKNWKYYIDLRIGLIACYFLFFVSLYVGELYNQDISSNYLVPVCTISTFQTKFGIHFLIFLEVIQRQYLHCHLISFFEENLFCLCQQRSPTKVQ